MVEADKLELEDGVADRSQVTTFADGVVVWIPFKDGVVPSKRWRDGFRAALQNKVASAGWAKREPLLEERESPPVWGVKFIADLVLSHVKGPATDFGLTSIRTLVALVNGGIANEDGEKQRILDAANAKAAAMEDQAARVFEALQKK